MSIRGLVISLIVLWSLFAVITFTLPADHVFHVLNALSIAAGVMTIAAFWPGVTNAWATRYEKVTPATFLALGVTANWLGFLGRLGRWYITGDSPADGISQWSYNVGLFVSICAAFLLTGVVAASDPPWSRWKVFGYGVLFVVITCGMVWVDSRMSH